jgi:hypothetical protein
VGKVGIFYPLQIKLEHISLRYPTLKAPNSNKILKCSTLSMSTFPKFGDENISEGRR